MLNLLLPVWVSSLVLLAAGDSAADTTTQCNCFKTSSNAIYQNQAYFDFRKGKPKDFDSFFNILDVSGYSAGPTKNRMSKSQVTWSNDHLTLAASNKNGQQYAAELESRNLVHHGSFRAHFAVEAGGTGGEGAVAGFFTFKDGGENEADIEILTSEAKNKAHYSTHILGGAGGGNPTLVPDIGADWSKMMTHRFDWENGRVAFWANENNLGELKKGVPTQPSTLCLNMWSSGDSMWGGKMKEGGEARMNVQWLQAFYNGTDSGKTCGKVCYVG